MPYTQAMLVGGNTPLRGLQMLSDRGHAIHLQAAEAIGVVQRVQLAEPKHQRASLGLQAQILRFNLRVCQMQSNRLAR